MSNGGLSNASPNNTMGDDSDDEYEAAGVAAILWYYQTYVDRLPPQPKHTSAFTGIMRVDYLLDGHEDVIRNKIRMGSDCFNRLSSLLELKGYLRPTRNMNVDEQLFIFLYIVSQSQSNRESQDQWQHSGSTISKYFEAVLEAICNLRHDFITPPNFNIIDPVIDANGSKYLPWFKNCVGALDGTHVPCVPPSGKYYLVDSGYANNDCFLVPYRGSTYHLQEYRARRGRPRTQRELFNYTHSSLRNAIERTFGVWKARFRILKCINNYPIEKQIQIPIACAVLHNFIHMYNNNDELLN
ncbi:uncharacterized protein LOC112095350 [Morus notabilis]|uniref:uncharacterized protein LOC112095350 n=1 Tax=Morus notabilis TaxID=981085 RepID=UPI000CED3020|nr:uncharacterized protein LOC112095350 [Morus notabilis]